MELNKTVVLNVLKQQASPISLPDMLKRLGPGYAERTVRRWLADWVKSGLVQKSGHKRSTLYSATTEPSTTAFSAFHFDSASQKILAQINQPYELRHPVTYQMAWLQNYKPNEDFYIPASLQEKLFKMGRREHHHEPAGTYAKHIYQRLLIDLSYNSSRLEGNTYSLLDTKNLILDGIQAPGKLNEEATMILNHKEAIRYLVNGAENSLIDSPRICTLHFLLSDGLVAPQYAGKVRDYGVRITGSVYIPLENPAALNTLLSNICQKADAIKNPYEQSIFLLAHLAYLQAFVDVNKRTARLAANIPLINQNLVPLSFNDVKQEDYTAAMIAIYELNDIRPLVDLYAYSYLRTSSLYDTTIEAIHFDPIRVKYRQERRDIIRYILSHRLTGEKRLSYINTVVKQQVNESDQAQVIKNIYDDLEQLGTHNITGLGISQEELRWWMKHKT